MAKAKPIPIAITNCAHTHTQHNRHCAYATLPTVQLGISTAILPNSNTEIKSNYDKHGQPGSPFTPLLELLQKYVACQVTVLGGGDRGRGKTTCVLCKCGKFMATYISLCASHMSFMWTFGHYNKQSPKNIAWICLGSAQSQASDKLKGRLMNGLCK